MTEQTAQQPPDWAAELQKLVKNFDVLKDTVEQLEKFAEAMGKAGDEFSRSLAALQVEHVLVDWKVNKVLSALDPERFPDPGPPPDAEVLSEFGSQEESEGSTDQPAG